MQHQDFLHQLESELAFTGILFARAEAIDFIEAAWPLIQEDPDPQRWAREFLEAKASVESKELAPLATM